MRTDFDAELEDRLVRYCAIDTQSDETSPTSPSTEKQFDLLRLLEAELLEMGADDVGITDYGALLATVPASAPTAAPTIALMAHVDTAPGFPASGVKPRVHRAYDGGDIRFPDAPELVLSPATSPYLGRRIGDDIVTASGATLLGADDKAGVAIVMTIARHLLRRPGVAHGPIRLAFTPDEEIGRGVNADLPRDLRAQAAYTFDGGDRGEVVFETFSADKATIRVEGVSIHPGAAKGRLVNALHLAAKIVDLLPKTSRVPEATEGREGFLFAYSLKGTAAAAEIGIFLRDFEIDGLAAHGALLQRICDAVAAVEPRARISCEIAPQYRNMRYWLESDMRPVDYALRACRETGLEPFTAPIRGGTDGSRLTEMGVPTPNVFTGMQQIHGPLEWVSVQDMAAAARVGLKLVELWAREAG